MKIYIAVTSVLVIVLQAHFGESQEPSPRRTAQDLSGKWEGTPPLGGTLEMEIEVLQSGEIKGKGMIRQGGSQAVYAYVSGEVKGQKVGMETRFPYDQAVVRYRCVWEERDTLRCTAGPKNFQTEFKRVGTASHRVQ